MAVQVAAKTYKRNLGHSLSKTFPQNGRASSMPTWKWSKRREWASWIQVRT